MLKLSEQDLIRFQWARIRSISSNYSTGAISLQMNEISKKTGTAHSTTFRILRTLADRGYVLHHRTGDLVSDSRRTAIVPRFDQGFRDLQNGLGGAKSSLSSDQVIESELRSEKYQAKPSAVSNARSTQPRALQNAGQITE